MGNWFRRFLAMPDRQRAKILAQILAVFLIAVLYGLGGLGVYLRARYLGPIPTPMRTLPPGTMPSDVDAVIATSQPMTATALPPTALQPTPLSATPASPSPTPLAAVPTRTLYPTITPAP